MDAFVMERDGEIVRIKTGEQLTAAHAPDLQAALKREIAGGAKELVFDLANTLRIDSTGIGVLVAANNSLREKQGKIQLVHVPSAIMKLLQSMRMVGWFNA